MSELPEVGDMFSCGTCSKLPCVCLSNPTQPPDAQAMTREEFERTVYILSAGNVPRGGQVLAHDAAQRETIARLEKDLAIANEYLAACHGIEDNLEKAVTENEELQARLTASEAKRKWTSQPTSEGWYFWRRIVRQKEVQTVVRVKKNWGNAKLYIQACRYVEDCHGEWQGPLTPREE